MKSFIFAAVILGLAAPAQADTSRFVAGDASDDTRLCLAALQSDKAFDALADELGTSVLIRQELRCNNLSLSDFVRSTTKHKLPEKSRYRFTVTDDQPYSRICLAAVSSSENYRNLTSALRRDYGVDEKEIRCNGMNLKSFVLRYGKREAMSLSSR